MGPGSHLVLADAICKLSPCDQGACTCGMISERLDIAYVLQGEIQSHNLDMFASVFPCDPMVSAEVLVPMLPRAWLPTPFVGALLCHFMSPALRHGCLQGQFLFFQEVLNSVSVHEPSNDLVADIFLQKLHFFASSLRATRKSSNDSPSCCTRCLKLRRSTDSLSCFRTYCSIADMISSTLPRWATVMPRLSTIVTVSLEKHKVRACTCLLAGCLSRPDRLKYASH